MYTYVHVTNSTWYWGVYENWEATIYGNFHGTIVVKIMRIQHMQRSIFTKKIRTKEESGANLNTHGLSLHVPLNLHLITGTLSTTWDLKSRTNRSLSSIKSADPGLRQGRGGAWDHRRCGTCFVTMALTLSRVLPCTPLRSLPFRKPCSQPPRPSVFRVFKAAVCPPSNPSNPSNPQNLQNAPNPPQAFPRQPSKQAPCTSWQPATTAICF